MLSAHFRPFLELNILHFGKNSTMKSLKTDQAPLSMTRGLGFYSIQQAAISPAVSMLVSM